MCVIGCRTWRGRHVREQRARNAVAVKVDTLLMSPANIVLTKDTITFSTACRLRSGNARRNERMPMGVRFAWCSFGRSNFTATDS